MRDERQGVHDTSRRPANRDSSAVTPTLERRVALLSGETGQSWVLDPGMGPGYEAQTLNPKQYCAAGIPGGAL